MSSNALLPPSAGSCIRVPWTSSVSLHRFVWVIQLDVGFGTAPRSDCDRASLTIWLRKLDISVRGSESGAPASSPDEQMLDSLVASIGGEMTPKGVLLCFFSVLGDLLFCMINDCVFGVGKGRSDELTR